MITGVFAAAHDLRTGWVVVKGIKDFADDSQPSSNEWGRFASVMATSVVANILCNPVVFQEWPNYQGNNSRSTLPLPLLLLHRHIYGVMTWRISAQAEIPARSPAEILLRLHGTFQLEFKHIFSIAAFLFR